MFPRHVLCALYTGCVLLCANPHACAPTPALLCSGLYSYSYVWLLVLLVLVLLLVLLRYRLLGLHARGKAAVVLRCPLRCCHCSAPTRRGRCGRNGSRCRSWSWSRSGGWSRCHSRSGSWSWSKGHQHRLSSVTYLPGHSVQPAFERSIVVHLRVPHGIPAYTRAIASQSEKSLRRKTAH